MGGTDELKDAVIAKLKRDNRLTYRRSEVVISCGAKHSLFNIAQVLFEEGDEVLIPSPYWVSYTDIVYLTGAKPVVIKTNIDDGFKLQPPTEAAITPRTERSSNTFQPGRRLLQSKGMEALASESSGRIMDHLSDDIYEKIIYDDVAVYTLASTGDKAEENFHPVINRVSRVIP